MASERQIAANRRNAQKSTGPKTQAGRERSRMNALTHGLSRTLPAPEGPDPRVLPLARALAGEGVTDPATLFLAEEIAVASLTLVTIRALRASLLGADVGAGERAPEAKDESALVLETSKLDRFERQAFTRRRRALAHLDGTLPPYMTAPPPKSDKTNPNRCGTEQPPLRWSDPASGGGEAKISLRDADRPHRTSRATRHPRSLDHSEVAVREREPLHADQILSGRHDLARQHGLGVRKTSLGPLIGYRHEGDDRPR